MFAIGLVPVLLASIWATTAWQVLVSAVVGLILGMAAARRMNLR
jgi:hypothetical protein